MKNYKRKIITKEELKNIPPEAVLKDLNIVNDVLNKLDKISEDIDEPEADIIKKELEAVENYLKNQYKDYINVDIEDDILKNEDIQSLYNKLSDENNLDTKE
tara:strand:- start:402 stop:707 length:306 start_codon:yes stop_codon:yes gene_type:complete